MEEAGIGKADEVANPVPLTPVDELAPPVSSIPTPVADGNAQ